MRSIVAVAILAIGLAAGTIGSQAQAETVWHFPYKGTPYTTETTPTVCVQRTRHGYGPCRVLRHPAGEKPCQNKTRR
jgi:hypothetical protein